MWALVRIAFKEYMNRYYKKSRSSDKIIVVTAQQEIENVMHHIRKDAGWSYEIIGIVIIDAGDDRRSPGHCRQEKRD